MYRQVGDLRLDKEGVAQRGLLVRHLVLPNGQAGTRKVLAFLAEEISSHTYISIMSQYFPAYEAQEFKELNRRITRQEYQQVLDMAEQLGLETGWRQN